MIFDFLYHFPYVVGLLCYSPVWRVILGHFGEKVHGGPWLSGEENLWCVQEVFCNGTWDFFIDIFRG